MLKNGELNARWIQLPSVDHKGYVGSDGVLLTNIRGLMADEIAQTVLGGLLGVYRGIFQAQKAQIRKDWKRWTIRNSSDSLSGKTVLFLGGGAIVQACIKLLKPFDCSVIVYRRQQKKIGSAKMIYERSDVLAELKNVDVVINALPSDEKTNDFMDTVFFNACRPHCVVLNVGRGSTVNEKALLYALKNKKIRAAVLDVTKTEPLSKTSPLWNQEGLYLMQHTAGGHNREENFKSVFFAENLKRYLSKKPLINQVRS
jgi:phosphoglycerate dehydrogenase-like enzyme